MGGGERGEGEGRMCVCVGGGGRGEGEERICVCVCVGRGGEREGGGRGGESVASAKREAHEAQILKCFRRDSQTLA